MTLTIERGIPIPPRKQAVEGLEHALKVMEPGDSVFIPPGAFANINSCSSAISGYGRKNGKKFSTRKSEGGIRVWRIA